MAKNIITIALVAAVGISPAISQAQQNKAEEIKFERKISVHDPSLKGYILCDPNLNDAAPGSYAIIDMAGNIIVQKQFQGTIFDFRQWKIGNKVYYTYEVDDSSAYHNPVMQPRVADGHVVVLDSALNEIKTVHLIPHDGIDRKGKEDIDPHDLIMLGENHFITMISYEKEVDNIPASVQAAPHKRVYACIIQESVDGKVVWQWDATRFPEFYVNSDGADDPKFSKDIPSDYTHANTITLDPKDSNLIISFRDMNQIIKVDRHSGNIMWRLGGKNSDFPLTETQRFYGQHYVKFADDNKTLMFVDNGQPQKRPYSRIAEFQLDEQNKRVSSFSGYKVPNGYIKIRGSVQKLGDNYMICGGIANYLLIVDPKTDRYLFHLQSNMHFYRGYYVENIYGLEKRGAIK